MTARLSNWTCSACASFVERGLRHACSALAYDVAMREKKASGRNVREAERGTVQVKLRLPPDVAEDLDDLAARWRLTRSGAVARLVERATDTTRTDPST